MKYEDEVAYICGHDWNKVGFQEKDGGYGVACLKAFLKGVRPVPVDLAAHLSIKPEELMGGYSRLNKNGVFSPDYAAKHDPDLLGETSQEEFDRAWGHVAAVAGGFMGYPWTRV